MTTFTNFICKLSLFQNELVHNFSKYVLIHRYLNTQHIKKQKATDAELLYGSLSYESPEQMKEIGELGLLPLFILFIVVTIVYV